MMGYGYGMSGFGWIGSLLFIALLVLGIVYLVRALEPGRGRAQRDDGYARGPGASDRGAPHGDAALQILRERYARGEIDRDEFEQRRMDLS